MSWRYVRLFVLLGVVSCAGFNRSCSSYCAENLGSDWMVVQYRMDGAPMACWTLRDTSITNEQTSDGIYWLDIKSDHLVHISGWYNRVQVAHNDFLGAAELLGVDASLCRNGKYNTKVKD